MCLRFIWLMFSQSESLWAEWHRKYSLNGISLWAVQESLSDSWAWKQILKLRPEGRNFIKPILGNGQKISFWFDSWTPLGQLIQFLGQAGPRQLRVQLHASVSAACSNTGWCIASPRSDEAMELHTFLTSIPCPVFAEATDSYVWTTSTCEEPRFNATKTWQDLRPRGPTLTASDLIWFKGGIPRNNFTMWVANADRLPTRARLASWGLQIPTQCCLCSISSETRDHLFLTCQFSMAVWRLSVTRLGEPNRLFCSWAELLSWIRGTSTAAPSILRKLVAQAAVYHLWKQRNNVLHNQIVLSPDAIFRLIDKELKNTINARRKRKQFLNLMSKWMS